MSDDALIRLPDPEGATLPTLVRACDQLTHLLRTEPPQDMDTAVELLDQMAAIERFLSKKGMAWAAQTPARLLEAHIGKLLGPPRPSAGRPPEGEMSARGHFPRQRHAEFYLMDQHRPPWEPDLPLSRRSALVRIQRTLHPPGGIPGLPDKTYGLIYADPPWPMPTDVEDRSMERHYPPMSIEDIKAIPIKDIARPDSLLYLWAISTHLHDAFHVMETWGFDYISSMVWIKDRPGTGWWVRHQHEYLLIGRRGKWSPPPFAQRPVSIISAPRTAHSAKPVEVAEMLERLWPGVPRIELFSRDPRPGWDVIGDEASDGV